MSHLLTGERVCVTILKDANQGSQFPTISSSPFASMVFILIERVITEYFGPSDLRNQTALDNLVCLAHTLTVSSCSTRQVNLSLALLKPK